MVEGSGRPDDGRPACAPGRNGIPPIGDRCATAEAGGVAIGAPSPARRELALDPAPGVGFVAPAAGSEATDRWTAVSPDPVRSGAAGATESGEPRPTAEGAGADAADSAQRLAVRAGPVPRGGGVARPSVPGGKPGAVNDSAGGRPADADAAWVPAGPLERWVTATGSGARVRGRTAGTTVAAGETVAICRSGAAGEVPGAGATAAPAAAPPADAPAVEAVAASGCSPSNDGPTGGIRGTRRLRGLPLDRTPGHRRPGGQARDGDDDARRRVRAAQTAGLVPQRPHDRRQGPVPGYACEERRRRRDHRDVAHGPLDGRQRRPRAGGRRQRRRNHRAPWRRRKRP